MTAPAYDGPVHAVTFDLDDTLYPQADYLSGAWSSVVAAAQVRGVERADALRLHDALLVVAAEGSDRGGIIDRALDAAGLPAALVPHLVTAFKTHAPDTLATYPGVTEALDRLRARVPVAIVTDGDPVIQRAKLRALGVEAHVDAVVISDELGGRQLRKPCPEAFVAALQALGSTPAAAVHVGDRYAKDVAGASAAGMRGIRVLTGEYACLADPDGAPPPWRTCADAVAAVELILELLA